MAADEQSSRSGERPNRASGSAADGQVRLRAAVLGIPPPALADSTDYARYEALLPLLLAGAVLPGSTDYIWFMGFLTEWSFCAAEYTELQRLFLDPPNTAGLIVADDLAFLRPATQGARAEPAPAIVSLADLRARLELRGAASHRRLQVSFTATAPAPLAQVAEPVAQWLSPVQEATHQPATANPATATDPTAMLLFTVGSEDVLLAACGLRGLTLAVQPDHDGRCRVRIGLAGPTATLPHLTLTLASGDTLPVTLDRQGQGHSPPIALTALASAVITIAWPRVP